MAAAGPRVEPIGPLFMGQEKWLGGVGSPCGRYIYGAPGHARRVLRVTVATGDVDLIGPEFPPGLKYKFLRGVTVPQAMTGPSHPKGLCMCLPSNYPGVLVIDPATQEVTTIGGELEDMHGEWRWHGGQLCDDGMVYAVPCNATRVLQINPRTLECRGVGPVFEGKQKWYGGILSADGCMYAVPHKATRVLKVVPGRAGRDPECLLIGDELPEGGWKWHGGSANSEATVIFGFPNNADTVLRIDTRTDAVTTIGGPDVLKTGRHRNPPDGKYKYLGGAVSGRHMYCFPCDAERVLRINLDTDECDVVGPEFLHDRVALCMNKWQNGFAARDGAVYAIPQRAPGVLRVDPHHPDGCRVEVLECPPEFDEWSDGADKFEGGVLGSDGCIYCMPLRAKRVLRVVPGPPLPH